MDKSTITLTLEDWEYTCADGCCYDYGTDIMINGERVSTYQSSTYQSNLEQTLREVLEYLGHKVEIKYEKN